MKRLYKLSAVALAAAMIAPLSFTAKAGGLSGVLDGMFANVTAPDTISSQLRGTIVGGGMYVRSPISSIQVMSLDPPRLNAGCGGIDLYLGSFSFITAEKLTQFIRSVAQNAAPLAFKMALDASFPQLGGVLDKFQHMAQMMNDSQRNSCQLAQGLLDGAKNGDALEALTKSVGDGMASIKGWATDFTDAISKSTVDPSENVSKARQQKNADGTQVLPKLGNITWNTLNVRKLNGLSYRLTSSEEESKHILLSLVGTTIRKEGTDQTAEPVTQSFPAQRVRLADLFRPPTNQDGAKEITIWSCKNDPTNCLNPTPEALKITGIEGYVRKMMLGSDEAQAAGPGSIAYKLENCSSSSGPNCGLSDEQKNFLKAIGKVPAVAMLRKASGYSGVSGMVLPDLINSMVDEISVAYGRAVIEIATSTYAGSDLPKPENFEQTIRYMVEDVAEAQRASMKSLDRINTVATYIDTAVRTSGGLLRYRPR